MCVCVSGVGVFVCVCFCWWVVIDLVRLFLLDLGLLEAIVLGWGAVIVGVDVNKSGSGVLRGRAVLTRSSPAGGNCVEYSVIHAPEDVSIFVEQFHYQLRPNDPASRDFEDLQVLP